LEINSEVIEDGSTDGVKNWKHKDNKVTITIDKDNEFDLMLYETMCDALKKFYDAKE
jgi:hypothetical protein